VAIVNPRKKVIKSVWSSIAAMCKDSADLNVESDFRVNRNVMNTRRDVVKVKLMRSKKPRSLSP
jgi:hypothetical protein